MMWVHTKDGFYSVVRKPGETRLTVRARAAADLERLRDRHLPELGEVQAGGGTDYPYRARVDEAAWVRALASIVADLDYANFKSEVAASLGAPRAAVLGEVWTALQAVSRIERDAAPAAADADADTYGGVLVDDAGRVLLREPRGHYGGYTWTFAKGRAEHGERPEAAALREVREETGIEARIVGRIPGRFAGDTTTTVFFLMQPVRDHGDFDRAETSAVAWLDPDEARARIGTSRSSRGRTRDLSVLDSALRARQAKGSR
jgi:8-oxo-dGTP pyrophosphatase MutT (NUDIX family)